MKKIDCKVIGYNQVKTYMIDVSLDYCGATFNGVVVLDSALKVHDHFLLESACQYKAVTDEARKTLREYFNKKT